MTIYLMRNFMKTVPDSLLEAAEIDGCSKRKALTKIMIPLSVPALITSSLVNLVDFACFSSERRIANLNGRDYFI